MLRFYWRSVTADFDRVPGGDHDGPFRSVADTNPELKIRNLLDDPRLRACLTRSEYPSPVMGRSVSSAHRNGAARAAA